MGKSVLIDTEECVGCESCVEFCPEIFQFDADSEKAIVIKPEGGDADCIEEAMASCPSECIHWDS